MSYFDALASQNNIVFVAMMELGWEIQRWASAVNHFINNNPNKQYIIATFPDRIDLYKNYQHFCPINIDGLYVRKRPDMYKVQFMDDGEYDGILTSLKANYPDAFVIEPPKSNYGRWVFSASELDLDFKPRPLNSQVVHSLLTDRPTITLAPRHRKDCKDRNWPYWDELYDMLKDYTVFVAGANASYARPKNMSNCVCLEDCNREGTSTIGLVIEAMRASKVTVGQQSGNPILSLHLGTPVISWGHEKQRHAVDENYKRTPCYFFDDPTYSVRPEVIYQKIVEMTNENIICSSLLRNINQ